MLPVGEALNVVRRRSDGELVIRCDAGHDFCRFDEQLEDARAGLRPRHRRAAAARSTRGWRHCDPEWMELREFYCPISGRLLEIEAVTPGYPVVHDFLPDVEGFYRGWLGRELP